MTQEDSNAADGDIVFSRDGGLAGVTLNRPQALNALTQPMAIALDAQLREWQGDPAVRAVAIRGAAREDGRVPFCSGGDIRFLHQQQNDPTRQFAITFYEQEYRLNTLVYRFTKPYVALIDGVVMGGGVGISFHGSHRVMSEHALFAMPETGIGLFPDVGATYFLPRCPGRMGLYMGLSGARVGVADALYLGLATHHVPSARMAEFEAALAAADLSGNAKSAIDAVLGDFSADPGDAPLADRQADVDRCFAADSVEAILVNLAAEGSPWAEETRTTLLEKSPTSLKITFRQLTQYSDLDFEAAMKVEYRMAIRCNFSHEFYEGIRAQIIDKDRQPKWLPARLEDVGEELIESYFQPPASGDMTFE
ncbi:MAG: enoyl-CoA hydratase/isomerase family protein [Proteobacteria bacterium]|nr:enoyl-CoA hydratase/isomerase family protein [Pseudomonadota bacterium]MDA1355512.1 enoyl-CoA hydratase/isomerase family protein [Pseudomonadota bacterium]